MEVKTFFMAMGIGAAAGTAVGMMLPRNRTMRKMGREISSAAADTVNRAADAIQRTLQ